MLSYVANLTAADLYLRSGEATTAWDCLNACPVAFRDWEWHYLRRQCDPSLVRMYLGETIPADSAAFGFSPDGRHIFWNDLHTVYSWDVGTGNPSGRFSGFGSILSISRDGSRMVSRTYTGAVEGDFVLRVFDLQSRKPVSQLSGHTTAVNLAVFDVTGTRIASAAAGGTVKVWDVQSGANLGTLPVERNSVDYLAISRGGGRVAVSGRTGETWIWDLGSGQVRRLDGGDNSTCLAFSPDGMRVVSGGADRRLRVWDAQKGTLLLTSEPEGGEVVSVAFSPDGSRILAGTTRGAVQIRDTATGVVVGTLLTHTFGRGHDGVRQISFTPDGARILTADGEVVRMWDAENYSSATLPKMALGEEEFATALAVTPDHSLVATGARALHLWDTHSASEIGLAASGSAFIEALAFSPDSRLLAAGLVSGVITVYDVPSRRPVFTLTGHHARVTQVVFSADGKQIISSSLDRTVRVWRTESHTMSNMIELADPVNSVAMSPDGRRLVTGAGDLSMLHANKGPTVRVWDAATGRIILDIDTSRAVRVLPPSPTLRLNAELRGVQSVAFSPDGHHILTVENAGANVSEWNASSGALLRTFRVSMPAAFLSGGNRIIGAARAADRHLAILDVDSGERLLTLKHELTPFTQLAVAADGTVVEQPLHGPIRLWDATPSYEVEAWNRADFLYSQLGFYDAVAAAIRSDLALSPAGRKVALWLAGTVRDNFPDAHDRASWAIVKSPGGQTTAYRQALEHSLAACRLAPWNPGYVNTLGIAQYRLGLHSDAVDSLSQARRMRGSAFLSNLAFTAMAQYRLGRRQEALGTLHELQLEMRRTRDNRSQIEGNADALSSFVREAESVISPAATRPPP
jgi:WD40 repeat protein